MAVLQKLENTGCLLISVACLSVHNLVIFWCLRGEILNTETSKVYKFVHMTIQIKTHQNIKKLHFIFFGQFEEKAKFWKKFFTKIQVFV